MSLTPGKRSATSSSGPSAKRQKGNNAIRAARGFITAPRAPMSRHVAPHGEIKYVDGYLDATALHSVVTNDDTWADCELNPRQVTAVYGCLPVPRQGTNYADRDGRKIFVKKIKIRGIVQFDGADALTGAVTRSFCRLVVVKDTNTNGVALSAENVLGAGLGSDGNSSLLADTSIMAMTNPDGWSRYQIMKDKIIRPPPTQAFNDGTDGALNFIEVPFKMNITCNCYMNFNASTGAIGSIIDNSFHLIAASNEVTLNTNVSYIARTSFIG